MFELIAEVLAAMLVALVEIAVTFAAMSVSFEVILVALVEIAVAFAAMLVVLELIFPRFVLTCASNRSSAFAKLVAVLMKFAAAFTV